MVGVTTATSVGIAALRDMRTDRRKRRVADMEWFELLYRVYLAALIGGFVVLYLSSLVQDAPFTASQFDAVITDGPRVAGLLMAVVCFLGMRSGAQGGPVNVEDAEVRHVLLAPVDRGAVLRRPAAQRLRTAAFTGAIAGGASGLVISKRVPESWGRGPSQFVILGAAGGAMIVASFMVAALLVHTLRVPRFVTGLLGGGLVAWQAAAVFAASHPPAPFSPFGDVSLAMVRGSGITAAAVLAALAALSLALTGRLSLEALARRSALVSQLKFAVTLQDIRTVVLLRRQLSQEHMREKPWFRVPGVVRRDPVTARCLRSLAHFPLRRLVRMSLLSVTAAVALVGAWRGTTPLLVVSGLALFVLGLDIIEPLSQEIDQPDRTDSLPVERGLLHARHLAVPALATVPFVLVGGAAAWVLEPHAMTLVAVALLGIPAALAGVAGAVVNAVKGAPDPAGTTNQGLYMPPEVSGMTTVVRTAWPPVISVIGSTPVVALVHAHDNGNSVPGVLVRTALGVGIVAGLVAGWVRQRDAISAWFRDAASASNSPKPAAATKETA